jgi:phage baseplate assembly protein W
VYKDTNEVGRDAKGIDAIKNSIRNILLTRRGSVPGKPRFGSDLHRILFQPLDHLTESIASNYIRESLSEYEPRISVKKLTYKNVEEFNKLVINLEFTYRDNDFDTNNVEEISVTFNI